MLGFVGLALMLGFASCATFKDANDKLMELALGHIYGIDTSVVELNDDNFKDELAQFDTAFVEFVAPWCPHCKRLLPDFDRAAKVVDKAGIPVKFVKVNCDGPGYNTCQHAKADIYPTLKLYRKGVEERRYYGPRTPKDLVRYAQNMVGDHARTITTQQELEEFTVSDSEYMFVGAFAEDSDLSKDFLKKAEALREFNKFAVVRDPDLLKIIGQTNAVIAYQPKFLRNKWEPDHKVFDDIPFKLLDFIQAAKRDLVGIVTRDTTSEFEISRPLLITTFDIDFDINVKHTNYVRNRLLKLASEYSPRMSFCMGNLNMTSYYGNMERWNDTGILLTVIDEDGWDYTVPKDVQFSYENTKQVIEDVLAGKIKGKPFKSDELPKKQKIVKKVIANTFAETVLDETKHVLVEFYSPYCEHCKALIPTYNELASRAREDDTLLITKMDATANSIPKPFQSRGFPTIYLVPKGKNSRPIKYEGDRSIDSLTEFIQENTFETIKFVEPEEKYLKKSGKTEEETNETEKDSGSCSADDNGGQCSAGKTEL